MNEILKELAEDIKKDLIFYIENDFKEKLKKEMLKELKDEFKEDIKHENIKKNSLNKEIIESEQSEGSEQSEDYYNYVTNSDIENVKNNVTIEQNKVSILLPVYNNKQDILKAIKSVELQTYKDWELIIIDDYSTDNTYETLKEYVEKSDFKNQIILKRNEKNIGCYSSLNEGLLLSKGEFITRLDSDDIYKRRKLEKQVNFLKNDSKRKACI